MANSFEFINSLKEFNAKRFYYNPLNISEIKKNLN